MPSTDSERPPAKPSHKLAPLSRALDQSEQVQGKVEQAAVDLSLVNEELKVEIAVGVPLAKVENALHLSEAIEVNVHDAAAELVAVNDALAVEIVERHHLEDQLSKSNAALSESRAQEKESRHNALHDAVTGLPNLTLFNDRLRSALALAERHAWRLAVMFIDLDDFKLINDARGHDVGDQVLQMVAQRLQTAIRGGDTVSRRSGDEFLFLMLEAKDESNAAALAARIGSNIAEAYEIDGVKLTMSASIGIALYPENGRSAEELLKHADAAMYAAKQTEEALSRFHFVASRSVARALRGLSEHRVKLLVPGFHPLVHAGSERAVTGFLRVIRLRDAHRGDAALLRKLVRLHQRADRLAGAHLHRFGVNDPLVRDHLCEHALERHGRIGVVALPRQPQRATHASLTLADGHGPSRGRQHPTAHLGRFEHRLPHEPTRGVERAGEDDGGVRGGGDLKAFGVHGVVLVIWVAG